MVDPRVTGQQPAGEGQGGPEAPATGGQGGNDRTRPATDARPTGGDNATQPLRGGPTRRARDPTRNQPPNPKTTTATGHRPHASAAHNPTRPTEPTTHGEGGKGEGGKGEGRTNQPVNITLHAPPGQPTVEGTPLSNTLPCILVRFEHWFQQQGKYNTRNCTRAPPKPCVTHDFGF